MLAETIWAGKIKVSIQTLQYINGKRDPTQPEYMQLAAIEQNFSRRLFKYLSSLVDIDQ